MIGLPNESTTGQIVNNTIVMGGGPNSSAIVRDNIAIPSDMIVNLTADVIANRISGMNYDQGIHVEQNAAGTTDVRILDNFVIGQGSSSGGTGAVELDALKGTLIATVVNNTFANGERGVATQVDSQFGGSTLSGLVANNIISGNTGVGLQIDPNASLLNMNNLVFGNASDSFTPGPGTITADPRFVTSGDYHLKPGSPAIDAGGDAAVPADLMTDLDGNPRIQGAHVDIGTYEAPEPTTGLGAAASLSALAALARRRYPRG